MVNVQYKLIGKLNDQDLSFLTKKETTTQAKQKTHQLPHVNFGFIYPLVPPEITDMLTWML